MNTGMVIVPTGKQYCCPGCLVMIHPVAPVYKPLLRRMIPCFCALLLTAPVVLAEDAAEIMQTGETPAPGKGVETGAGGIIRAESDIRTSLERVSPVHVHSIYESRYVTEGRDNLSGSGLLSASTDIMLGDSFTFIPWLAHSGETDYTELDLNLLYVVETEGLMDLYYAYNRVHTRHNAVDFNDNEIELGITYPGLPLLDFIALVYYSFDADGAFAELTALNEHTFSSRTSLQSTATLGFNGGYIADGHSGANNFVLKTELSYFFLKNAELTGYAGYNLPIGDDPVRYAGDAGLDEFFWSGIGLSWYF
jgi:hypothetical protein